MSAFVAGAVLDMIINFGFNPWPWRTRATPPRLVSKAGTAAQPTIKRNRQDDIDAFPGVAIFDAYADDRTVCLNPNYTPAVFLLSSTQEVQAVVIGRTQTNTFQIDHQQCKIILFQR